MKAEYSIIQFSMMVPETFRVMSADVTYRFRPPWDCPRESRPPLFHNDCDLGVRAAPATRPPTKRDVGVS